MKKLSNKIGHINCDPEALKDPSFVDAVNHMAELAYLKGSDKEKPKKLIRKFITAKLKEGEWEEVTDLKELNKLYALKVHEELLEIQESDHNDIMEFVDLIQVAFSFAKRNGFTHEQLSLAMLEKSTEKGMFGNIALNNLNPDNPSNKLYFDKQ